MANPELVFKLGLEGGGAAVFRTPLASGEFTFHTEINNFCLDDDDNEEWRETATPHYTTISAALDAIESDGLWILFRPIMVHPEYRAALWQIVQDIVPTLQEECIERWTHQRNKWRERCLPDSQP